MAYTLPRELEQALFSSPCQQFVVITCGIPGDSPPDFFFYPIFTSLTELALGSGKSTLAHTLTTTYPNFTRLSIDAHIFSQYGLAGIDCPVSQYEEYQAEAQAALKYQFRQILKEGVRDVVLDFSFWNRKYRDEWRVRNRLSHRHPVSKSFFGIFFGD